MKSIDGGNTWFQINAGIPDSEGNRFVGFLEMHSINPQILFAASGNNATGKGGIFRTKNGGETWEKVLSDDIFTVVTISHSKPDVIFAGSARAFYRSDNGGDTWQKYWKKKEGCWGPPGVRAGVPISAVVMPNESDTIFVNNYGGGNFKSTDGGKTWLNASKGYTGAHLHDIDAFRNTVATIGRSGPFRSYNRGDDWEGIVFSPANMAEWYAIALKPNNSGEIIIADEHQGVILKSTDSGNNWREVFRHPKVNAGEPDNRHGFKDIVYSFSNHDIVYAGMCRQRRMIDGDLKASSSYGMYKSVDSGETWIEINNGLQTSLINIHCIAVHPLNPDIVYIGTWCDGVFKTIDGGKSWVLSNNGLASADVRSLAIDTKNPKIVYAGLGEGSGIFKTTDEGQLWREINSGIQIECPSYLLPVGRVTQGVFYEQVVTMPKRIRTDYYSVPWTSIWDIVIDPSDAQTIYAADHQKGVYLSTDAGNNWFAINEGLSTKAVTALSITSDGNILYAATEGEGCFRWERYNLNFAIHTLKIVAGLESNIDKWSDINGDNRIGLEETIYALGIVAGIRDELPQ